MIINHNISALNTYRQMGVNQNEATGSMEKLSSGLRINKAGDDAAGLSISEKMRGQIRGLDQASRNAQDGVSLIQTAEGALSETQNILQRMRELAVQSSNDTLQNNDRTAIQDEVNQLAKEITRISETTEFNGQSLMKSGDNFNGKLHIGANKDQVMNVTINATDAATLKVNGGTKTDAKATEIAFVNGDADEFTTAGVDASNYNQASDLEIKINVQTASSGTAEFKITKDNKTYTATGVVSDLGAGASGEKFVLSSTTSGLEEVFKAGESITITAAAAMTDGDEANIKIQGEQLATDGINVSTQTDAENAVEEIDNALTTVSSERSKLGAYQNRLEHTISNLNTSSENMTAAESRIRDVDMAKEMMNMTKENIKAQAAQAMLSQANQAPQQVLQLLR